MISGQGYEMSVKDLESLLHVIAEKKKKMEQEEAETNLQILLDFLVFLKKKKLDELNEVLDLNDFILQLCRLHTCTNSCLHLQLYCNIPITMVC